jgi:predicted nucleotidyltransferase
MARVRIVKNECFNYTDFMSIKDLNLKENEKEAILFLKNLLLKKFNLLDFRIFGSMVWGNAGPESDIDVMVELEEVTPEIESQIDEIVFEINLEKDTFISTIIFSRDEIEEGPMSESPIYKVIQKEGISI